MNNKTILIGGCSFSESQKKYNHISFDQNKNWYPWTDLLDDEFGKYNNIINLARGSAGQSTIVSLLTKKLFELDFKVDKVIVQWSSHYRMFGEKEENLLENIHSQGIELLSQKGIDVFTDEYYDKLNQLGYDIVFNSLLQIFLFQNLLKSKGIDYTFFWGWTENTIDLSQYSFLLSEIYDSNFLRYKSTSGKLDGGMHDYANQVLGEENTEVEDGHPNSEAHKVFYNHVIRPILFG